MSEPFVAEIKMIGFNFAPRGWAYCDGQLLAISQNQALFSIIGTYYGGDGRVTFALPDLRSRTPIHRDSNHPLGARAGFETVSLNPAQIPVHTHPVVASSQPGAQPIAQDALLGNSSIYGDYDPASATALQSGTVSNAGSGQPHNNMQPYQTLGFVIALQGVFPSRN